MLNNWFNKSDDNQAGRLKQSLDGRSHASTVDFSGTSAELMDGQPPQRATTTPTALSTPHDAVLAELHGRRLEVDMMDQPVTEDLSPDQRRLNNPYAADPNSLTPTSDPLFDPFTGVHIGDLNPDYIS
jgi:hypothetical protein